MITIGQRVRFAIDDVTRGEFELALEHVSIAIDITSKRYYKNSASAKGLYKKLLKEYSWLLELMSLNAINLDESKFGNFPFIDNHGKEYKEPTFQDLFYHIIRCGLIHDEGLPSNFTFSDDDKIILGNKLIVLPKRIIWGLLGIIVFCPANKSQKTVDGYWLSIFEDKFIINPTFRTR